jgi:hypothetical protein
LLLVRVGFLSHLLWDRYGSLWTSLAEAAGAEPVFVTSDAVWATWGDERVAIADALAFRVAIASALALAEARVELLLVPELLPEGGGSRGAAQDPWVAALPLMLARTVPGLPPVVGVPVEAGENLESHAVTYLRRLGVEAGSIRRLWTQHRALAFRDARVRPIPAHPPAGAVAWLGQPWWATEPLARWANPEAPARYGAWNFPTAALRDEGRRTEPNLADSDAEALGALRRVLRAGDALRLRWVTDEASGAEAWLLRRARALAGEQLEVVALGSLATQEACVRALLEQR